MDARWVEKRERETDGRRNRRSPSHPHLSHSGSLRSSPFSLFNSDTLLAGAAPLRVAEGGEPERRRDLIGLEGGRKGDCRGGAEPRNWRTAATLRRGGVGRTLAARPTSPLSFSRASNTHRRTPDSADATGNHRVERGWRFPPRRSAVPPASVRGARVDRTADHRVEGSGASLVSI